MRFLDASEQSIALEIMTVCFGEGNRVYAAQALAAAFSGAPDAPVSFLALKEGTAVGHAQIVKSATGHECYSLLWLAVIPKIRHQGIGAALIEHAENHIRQLLHGAAGSIILVSECDQAYYASLGYRDSGKTHNGHAVMEKTIENY